MPALGEPGDGVPAGLVAGRPEVERGLGVVDPEAGRLEGRPERRTTGRVAGVLLLDVGVVVEGGDHRALLGAGHHQPEVLAYGEQLADHGRVAGDERAAVAGEVGALRERVDREDALERAAVDVGVQHRDGLGLPGALEVALVGDEQRRRARGTRRPPCAGGPGGSTRPVGLDGEFTQTSAGLRGPERRSASRWRRSRRRPARRPPRRSGRRARAGRPGRPAPSPRWVGRPAISSLEPMLGMTASRPRPVTPKRRESQSMQACRVSGSPIVTG